MASSSVVHVAVGVIERKLGNGERQILLSKRHEDAHQGGLWEFPGGKVEPGETLPVALSRELKEELDLFVDPLDPDNMRPLIQVSHDYGDKSVLLDVWLVTKFSNEPSDGVGLEGQQVRWVDVKSLNGYSFPEANVPIISACQLPEYYIVTPEYPSLDIARKEVAALYEKCSGMILFRQPNLSREEYIRWLDELLALDEGLGAQLMLSTSFQWLSCKPEDLLALVDIYAGKVRGVHLPFKHAHLFNERMLTKSSFLAVSCHSEAELAHAQKVQADFVTLSPVRETPSHPEAESLGWSRFKEWVKLVPVPVYALGGMMPSDLQLSFQHGAQGVAGISAWKDRV